MREVINYLFDAYANYSAFEIVLECLAFGFGIISVIYAKRENILVYPTGITCTLITMYFMFSERLIGHMMVNLFYTLMSIYGWWNWSRKENDVVNALNHNPNELIPTQDLEPLYEENLKIIQTTHTADLNRAWIAALEEELGSGYDEFRLCPADPRMKERKERGGTSYVLNSYIFVPEIGPFGEELSKPLNCLNCIPEPERTLMAFIVSDHQTVEATSDHTHSRAWTGSWKDVLRDIQPDRHRVGSAAPDHSKGVSNYLFVDGHVESWRASEVKRRVEAGENIAEPPGILAEG